MAVVNKNPEGSQFPTRKLSGGIPAEVGNRPKESPRGLQTLTLSLSTFSSFLCRERLCGLLLFHCCATQRESTINTRG